jgi:hypothetical protein
MGVMSPCRHIRQLAESHNVPMPVMDVAHQHMLSARAHGGEEMDWTALVAGQRIAAGLQPFAGRVSHSVLGWLGFVLFLVLEGCGEGYV